MTPQEKAEKAVEEFNRAEEEVRELIEQVKEADEELWEALCEGTDKRRRLCDAARKAVREARVAVGPFGVRPSTRNVWNMEKVVSLATERDELKDLLDQGVLSYKFDSNAAKAMWGPEDFKIYSDVAHSTVHGPTSVLGPKPDDDILA